MTENEHEDIETWSKGRIFKNLAALSVGVLLYLSAMIPSNELQSSLNFKDGLGTNAGAIGSMVNFLPSLMLTPYFIRKFGLKPSIVIAILVGSVSHFGNFHPKWYTLIPAHILAHIAIAPLWAAKGTYISCMAERYASLAGLSPQTVNSFFFGIFYSLYYSGYIFGNLLPYFILKRDYKFTPSEVCGYEFCDGPVNDKNENFVRPPDSQVFILFGTFSVISVIGAVVILVFLDNLKVKYKTEANLSRVLDSLRLCKRWEQICMGIMSCYRGLSRRLLVADFLKAYITCSWGMRNISYVMISFGLSSGLLSFVLGYSVRWVGRPFLFAFAVFSNLAIMLTMIFWSPNPDEAYVFFILVSFWGASNAVWESQVAALNPELFPDQRDAAYTNYSSFEHIGGMVGLAVSANLCTKYKVLGNLGVLAAAALSFTALQIGPLSKAEVSDETVNIEETTQQETCQPLLSSIEDEENDDH